MNEYCYQFLETGVKPSDEKTHILGKIKEGQGCKFSIICIVHVYITMYYIERGLSRV